MVDGGIELKNSKQLEILPNTYFYVPEHSASFSPFRKKTLSSYGQGIDLPPPVYEHVRYY